MNDKTLQDMIISTLDKLQTDVTNLQTDVTDIKADIGWIKGKLEGRSETKHLILTTISVAAAIGAVLVAILK